MIRTLHVLGDSFSDIGAAYVDTDETTAVAYAARRIGIRLTIPKRARPGASVVFAQSGAGTGSERSRVLDRWWAEGGIRQAEACAELIRRRRLTAPDNRTMFLLATGLNDVAVPETESIGNIARQVEILAAAGAADIRIALLPTFGPYATTGERINRLLPWAEHRLKNRGLPVALSGWGYYFDLVHREAERFGISDTRSAPADRGGSASKPASDSHFFYHPEHPSSRVHRIVGSLLARELRSSRGSRPSWLP